MNDDKHIAVSKPYAMKDGPWWATGGGKFGYKNVLACKASPGLEVLRSGSGADRLKIINRRIERIQGSEPIYCSSLTIHQSISLNKAVGDPSEWYIITSHSYFRHATACQ